MNQRQGSSYTWSRTHAGSSPERQKTIFMLRILLCASDPSGATERKAALTSRAGVRPWIYSLVNSRDDYRRRAEQSSRDGILMYLVGSGGFERDHAREGEVAPNLALLPLRAVHHGEPPCFGSPQDEQHGLLKEGTAEEGSICTSVHTQEHRAFVHSREDLHCLQRNHISLLQQNILERVIQLHFRHLQHQLITPG